MSRIAHFGQTQSIEITVLVDNSADLLLQSTDTVRRFTEKPLLAEHGFAALVDISEAGIRVLWDAGISEMVLVENAKRMEIDLTTIDRIALSHGHGDHTGAVTGAIRAIAVPPASKKWGPEATIEEIIEWTVRRRIPVVAHPAAFRERWGTDKDGNRYGPGRPPPRAAWEAYGAEIVLSEGPYQLAPGCWTTGTVPRRSFEKAGTSGKWLYRDGDQLRSDGVEDDQAIVIHVGGKGLVVLSGCAHSGILNTVAYAREISGVDRVWAILGGFHLAPADDEEIERTVDAIEQMRPSLVAPTHCTGFRALSTFALRISDAFVLCAVGTTFLF